MKLILEIIKENENMLNWFIEEVTYLQPKTNETTNTKAACPVGWGYRIHRLQRGKTPPPMSALDMN